MTRFRWLLPVLMCVSLNIPITGCNKSDPNQIRIAFVSNNDAAFWTICERGCDKAAQELGVKVVFKKPSPGTAAEQQRILQDLLTTGIQGVAVSANDAKNLQGFLSKVSAKVPLVMVDNDVPDPSVRRCYLGTHNYRAGRAAGELVKKAIPQGGKVAIFVGQSDATNAIERRQGVLDVLAGIDRDVMTDRLPFDAVDVKLGPYTLVATRTDGGTPAPCQQAAQDLLTKVPDINCMVGLWEYNPPALLRAVQSSASAKKPLIVGFDESYQTLEAIQKGSIVGTVVQDPFNFGYESMKILAGLVKKDESVLKNRKDVDETGSIFVPHRVITKDNVDAFYTELKRLKGD